MINICKQRTINNVTYIYIYYCNRLAVPGGECETAEMETQPALDVEIEKALVVCMFGFVEHLKY